MGKFGGYLSGKTHVKIGEMEMDLAITVEERMKLLSFFSVNQSSVSKGKLIDPKVVTEIKGILVGVLKRNFPDEPAAEVEGYVESSFEQYIMALAIAFNWIDMSKMGGATLE